MYFLPIFTMCLEGDELSVPLWERPLFTCQIAALASPIPPRAGTLPAPTTRHLCALHSQFSKSQPRLWVPLGRVFRQIGLSTCALARGLAPPLQASVVLPCHRSILMFAQGGVEVQNGVLGSVGKSILSSRIGSEHRSQHCRESKLPPNRLVSLLVLCFSRLLAFHGFSLPASCMATSPT